MATRNFIKKDVTLAQKLAIGLENVVQNVLHRIFRRLVYKVWRCKRSVTILDRNFKRFEITWYRRPVQNLRYQIRNRVSFCRKLIISYHFRILVIFLCPGELHTARGSEINDLAISAAFLTLSEISDIWWPPTASHNGSINRGWRKSADGTWVTTISTPIFFLEKKFIKKNAWKIKRWQLVSFLGWVETLRRSIDFVEQILSNGTHRDHTAAWAISDSACLELNLQKVWVIKTRYLCLNLKGSSCNFESLGTFESHISARCVFWSREIHCSRSSKVRLSLF